MITAPTRDLNQQPDNHVHNECEYVIPNFYVKWTTQFTVLHLPVGCVVIASTVVDFAAAVDLELVVADPAGVIFAEAVEIISSKPYKWKY